MVTEASRSWYPDPVYDEAYSLGLSKSINSLAPRRGPNGDTGNHPRVIILKTESDENGKFKTKKVPAGQYMIKAEKDGYLPTTEMVLVGEGTASASFTLQQPALIEGQVGLDGSFVDVFAVVEVDDSNGKTVFVQPTDNQGRFASGPLEPGAYS